MDSAEGKGQGKFVNKCVDCGKEFEAASPKNQRCDECRHERTLELKRQYRKRKRNLADEAVDATGEARRCRYCGKTIRTGDFCGACVSAGLDNLNTEYGLTNGWDKPKKVKERVIVTSGWRGRQIIGRSGALKRGGIFSTNINEGGRYG